MTKKIAIELVEGQARAVLAALSQCETAWRARMAATASEDESAEIGLDLFQLLAAREIIEREAVERFGAAIIS